MKHALTVILTVVALFSASSLVSPPAKAAGLPGDACRMACFEQFFDCTFDCYEFVLIDPYSPDTEYIDCLRDCQHHSDACLTGCGF